MSAWITEPALGFYRPKSVTVGTAVLSNEGALADLIPKHGVVSVRLARDVCLKKTVTTPKVSRKQAESLVATEMRQTLPGNGQGLVWRVGESRKSGGRHQWDVWIVKSSRLKQLTDAVSSKGVRLADVSVEGEASVAPFLDNRRRTRRPGRIWTGLAVVLPLAVVVPEVSGDLSAIRSLRAAAAMAEAETRELTDTAVALASTQNALVEAQQAVVSDVTVLNQMRERTRILGLLTSMLDDDVWLSELTIDQQSIRLGGYTSKEVVAIVQQIQNAPWTSRVQLDGPVSYDSFSNQSSFGVEILLKKAAAQ